MGSDQLDRLKDKEAENTFIELPHLDRSRIPKTQWRQILQDLIRAKDKVSDLLVYQLSMLAQHR